MNYEARQISKPGIFLLRMFIFIAFVLIAATILYKDLVDAFISNPFLNGLILFVILFGAVFTLRQIWRLYPEIQWLNNLRIADPTIQSGVQPKLLAPMATMLGNHTGEVTLNTNSMRTLLDSIGARLDEAHEISRYITGLLVFLGLLGTFWGLLDTLKAIGSAIGGLDAGAGEAAAVFEELKAGLQAPLRGMATAFSSSLFGLAGSLVIGFMDIQANQAQNRFYLDLEDWLSTVTDISDGSHADQPGQSGAQNSSEMNFAIQNIHKAIVQMDNRIEDQAFSSQNNTEALGNIANNMQHIATETEKNGTYVNQLVENQNQQAARISNLARRMQDFHQDQKTDDGFSSTDERD